MQFLRKVKARLLKAYNSVQQELTQHIVNVSYRANLSRQVDSFKAIQDWLIHDYGNFKLEHQQSLVSLRNELLCLSLSSRYSLASQSFCHHPLEDKPATLDPTRAFSLEEMRSKLKRAAPLNYSMFEDALNVGTKSYEELPTVSCSTENHPQSILFRNFLSSYLTGLTLDVGCGPQSVPSYFAEYPLQLVYGIDPISSSNDHPFNFYSGFGEFLPWVDESFDTVVSATTLDHYYLLDKGIEEANRVLRTGGFFVAWITEFPDAQEPYNPYIKMNHPYDNEHLFHINRSWYIPFMQERGFELVECLPFALPFSFLFMAFKKIS